MKRYLAFFVVILLTLTGVCFADEYDLPNMTAQELRELRKNIDEQLKTNHDTTSSEESRIESAVKTYVEDYYGSSNVSWAWFDYTYTKEWDYYTMVTHADVKRGNEKSRCDVIADVYKTDDQYQIAYLTVGNDMLIESRDEIITDSRVRKMLGLSNTISNITASEDSDDAISSSSTDNAEPSAAKEENTDESEPTKDPVIASRGDRNDTVKEIQNMLIHLRYLNGKADGDFGKKTEDAVIAFQRDNSLAQTGVITETVYNAISTAVKTIPESVTYDKYTAKEVYSKYETNEIAGDSEFKGKTIEVTGKVNSVEKSLFGTPMVNLKADEYGFQLLEFKFSKNSLDQLATLKENQTVTIRAKCTGWSIMFVYFEDGELL